MENILNKIVETKKQEIKSLYEQYSLLELKETVKNSPRSFYKKMDEKLVRHQPFFITEFKRKSPSEGWIAKEVVIEEQLQKYLDLGTSAVSVLTDETYFGGSLEDLKAASNFLEETEVCILNKDFILDEIQVYLARKNGADIILLIASILELDQFVKLKNIAESLGMGVLAEVHSIEEYNKVKEADITVLGINNRNLSNFKTALNNCNYIAQNIDFDGHIIAESGMRTPIDLQVAGTFANGFLIGTSLMQNANLLEEEQIKKHYFKACGIRTAEDFKGNPADLLGINFSPISKRGIDLGLLDQMKIKDNYVAIFYNNSEEEISNILEKHDFKYVQLYADNLSFEFISQLKRKVILALAIKEENDFQKAEQFAPFIDFFILDAKNPGKGEGIDVSIPNDFPYPFLLAGGMNRGNLLNILQYQNCIGIDAASGIETDGKVDMDKIKQTRERLTQASIAFVF